MDGVRSTATTWHAPPSVVATICTMDPSKSASLTCTSLISESSDTAPVSIEMVPSGLSCGARHTCSTPSALPNTSSSPSSENLIAVIRALRDVKASMMEFCNRRSCHVLSHVVYLSCTVHGFKPWCTSVKPSRTKHIRNLHLGHDKVWNAVLQG